MAIKGKKLNQNLVMFGEPLNDKAKNALERGSPTADQIIQSLPPSAFIPAPKLTEAEKVATAEMLKVEAEKEKLSNAKELKRKRLEKKKAAALEKSKERQLEKKAKVKIAPAKEVEVTEEEPTIIKALIESTPEPEIITMNLEEELKALEDSIASEEKEIMEEMPQAEVSGQVDLKDQILELLSSEKNPPSLDLISSWKEAYGKNGIHVMAFGEGEVYIYHHLTRGEWRKIKELMNKLKESQNPDEVEEKLKEKVVLYCVLWPSLEERWLEYCKAGILDSLYQMILLNSGFLTPQQSMLLTTQL
jgi:hypothetical protein